MDPHRTTGACGRRCAAAWRLSTGLEGLSQGALVEGCCRGQAGRFDSARRVRCLGERDLGGRSRILEGGSGDAARAERRWRGQHELLDRRQGLVRSLQDYRADASAARRMGRRPSELPGARLFRAVEEYAVQAADRTERGNAYGNDGKEPHAILPRTDGFSRRGKAACVEINRQTGELETAMPARWAGILLSQVVPANAGPITTGVNCLQTALPQYPMGRGVWFPACAGTTLHWWTLTLQDWLTLKPPQRHALNHVIRALFKDQRRARSCRQDILLEIGEVGAFPDRQRGCGSFFVGERRIAMEIRSRIVKRRVAKRQEARDVPVAQHRFVGIDIDREIEEIRNHRNRLAVAWQPSGLQNIDAFDDQDIRPVDLDPFIGNDVVGQMRIDRRTHRPPPRLVVAHKRQQRRHIGALRKTFFLYLARALEHGVRIQKTVAATPLVLRTL